MKKIAILCLCFVIALSAMSSFAIAEDFTIHAGVMFGDTADDIKAKETFEFQKSFSKDNNLCFKGVIAGYEGTSIHYRISEDGKMYDAIYEFTYSGKDRYDDLLNLLTEKYGEPIDKESDEYNFALSPTVDSLIKYMAAHPDKGDLYYEGWVIPYDSYNVKIELTYCMALARITYHYYTDEDMEKAIEEALYELAEQAENDAHRSDDL